MSGTRVSTVLLLSAAFFLAMLLVACSGVTSNSSSSNPPSASPAPAPGGSGSGTGSGSGSGGGSSSGGGSGSGGGGTAASGTQFVYTADALSFGVSGFQIGSGGVLTPVPGSPFSVPSRPPYINSPVAIAQAGKYLLVESMSADTATGVETYSIGSNGALTRATLASTAGTNSFTADGGSMAVDQKSMVVYLSGTGSFSVPNGMGGAPALGAYAINGNSSLSPLKGSPYNIQVGTVALDPAGRFVYAINNGQIAAIVRNADGSLGGMAPGSPMKLQGTPATSLQETCAMPNQASVAVNPPGTFLYIACGGSTSLNVLAVDSSGRFSSVQSLAPATADNELSGVALNSPGTLLIATEEAANMITVFTVDQTTGKLTPVSSVAAGTRPNSAAFDKSGSFAYVTNGSSLIGKSNFMAGSDNVSAYAAGKSGGVTPVTGSPFKTGGAPRSIIVVQP